MSNETLNTDDVAVIIPTLNEGACIAAVVDSFRRLVRNVYVIDGGSQDGTADKAAAAGATVIHQRGRGKGAAVRQALREIDAEIYVLVDGDSTYSASDLPLLLEPIISGTADMVVGIRDHRSVPAFNKLGNSFFNIFISMAYRRRLRDILSGYRAFTRQLARSIRLTRDWFETETEMTVETLEKGLRIEEVPIKYGERIGRTKLRPLHDGWRIGITMLSMIRDYRPLTVFMSLAVIFMLAGLIGGGLVLDAWLKTGKFVHIGTGLLSALSMLFGIQFFSIGMLADMMARRMQRIEEQLGEDA